MVSSGESQLTLEALFIFGLGNWIVLIIYVSCCKQAEKGQEEGRLKKLVDRSRLWQATKIFWTLIRYGEVCILALKCLARIFHGVSYKSFYKIKITLFPCLGSPLDTFGSSLLLPKTHWPFILSTLVNHTPFWMPQGKWYLPMNSRTLRNTNCFSISQEEKLTLNDIGAPSQRRGNRAGNWGQALPGADQTASSLRTLNTPNWKWALPKLQWPWGLGLLPASGQGWCGWDQRSLMVSIYALWS